MLTQRIEQLATVRCRIGAYESTVQVVCDHNDLNDEVAALAKRELLRQCGGIPFPMGGETYYIEGRQFFGDDGEPI